MHFEKALYSYLISYESLNSLISDRVYPLFMPQDVNLPAIVYQKISENRKHSLKGDTGYTEPVFQISCYAQSYAEIKDIKKEIRLALQNYSGLMGESDEVNIQAVLLESEIEGYEKDTKTYYVSFDFRFSYIEEVN